MPRLVDDAVAGQSVTVDPAPIANDGVPSQEHLDPELLLCHPHGVTQAAGELVVGGECGQALLTGRHPRDALPAIVEDQEPRSDAFINAVQVYAWSDGALYRLYAAPERVSDIALQSGETLVADKRVTGPEAETELETLDPGLLQLYVITPEAIAG